MKNRISAYIICWEGKDFNAKHISQEIIDHVDELFVIYSNETNSNIYGVGNWIRVPNVWFYGKKFNKCLSLHNNENLMIIIHADANYNNWPKLIKRCKDTFLNVENVGMWAPDIDFTPWAHEFTDIIPLDSNKTTDLWCSAQVDGIVWAISSPVIQRLKSLSYDENNLGHGIDWAAICYSYSNKMLVLRDLTIKVLHPPGSGYDIDMAGKQLRNFLFQLNSVELVHFKVLNSYIKSKNIGVKVASNILLSSLKNFLRKKFKN